MLLQELRYSFRSLTRTPSLTAISVMTVALGVGAGTALFSVVKAVLLNPLPYPDSDRLAWISSEYDSRRPVRTSLPDFDDWRKQNHSFTQMAAYTDAPFVASGGAAPEQTRGALVTEDFFATLGVSPALGRLFSAEEHKLGAVFGAVVIGHGLWQRAYGGDPKIIGRKIRVLGMQPTVAGVMPPGFAFPAGTELWVSTRALGEGNVRTAHNYWVVGRLRAGATMEGAGDDISTIARRLKQQYPNPFQSANASVVPLASHLAGSVRTPLLILFGAVGLLILIVCVNLANLLLVRASVRSRELAVRTALGAARIHIFRHLLVESLVLAAAGGALGFLLALWSIDLLRVLLPAGVPRASEVRIDGGVAAFAVLLSAAAGVLFGTLPSWRASVLNVHDNLKSGSRMTLTRRSRATQGALVISEVALSLVLLAGAGLLLESLVRLRSVDPGFRADRVLAANLSFPLNAEARRKLVSQYDRLIAGARALPGVQAAGVMKDLPLDPIAREAHFHIEGQPNVPSYTAGYRIAGPGGMEALQIPLLRGRRFAESDTEDAAGVVIIGAEMARRFWPDRDPIGQRIWFDSFEPKEHWLTIIGIAGDIRQAGLTEPSPAQAYVSFSQLQIKGHLGSANLVIRSATDPKSLTPAIRKLLRETNPEAAVTFRLMDDVLADATARQRFQTQVLSAFAALALILAAVGLYGVLAHTVTSNRAAIGIRMALGASQPGIFWLVARRALWLTSAGAAIGLAGCLALRSLLAKVVYGIGPSEPPVLVAAVAVMLAVSMAACWFPALRAMRADPMNALREE